jgi:hypothetical protein
MLPHGGKEHFVKLIRTFGKLHSQFMSAQIISQRIFQHALSWWKKLLETEKTQKQLKV